MRREEFLSDHPQQIAMILNTARIGQVGIITPDGYPRVVPINFVWLDDKIYFHTARKGEKYEAFEAEAKVTFSAEIVYSNIPSFWLGETSGCTATVFYESVLIRGVGAVVDDRREKAVALQTLMEKEQPEGKFRRFTADEPLYRKAIDEVGICRIDPVRIDLKVKLGQNRSRRVRQMLIEKLIARGRPRDIETAEQIGKTLAE